ncbi:checkpoint protein [Anaeramoeba flamelloides]|uniref:Checkpoint protein n=1 Tax=Anaeramoeba flamelloides TaxID=1746091 RepID=A0ABQ8XJR4_9EUKA|nr:checkpoint protein [Anaeramoeba flamelloides]
MKFHATIHDLALLIRTVQSLVKIDKIGIIHFTAEQVSFILDSGQTTDDIQVWCSINQDSIFKTYVIESLSENEIAIEVNFNNLLHALKTGQVSNEMSWKLTKKDNLPYLSISILCEINNGLPLVQDVPIQIITPQNLQRHKEPDLPEPDVQIMLPQLSKLQCIVDKMKEMANTILIKANMAGAMSLSIKTDIVSVQTLFKDLEHPQIEGQPEYVRDENKTAEIRVDIKKLRKVLYSHYVNPKNAVLCLVKNQALVVHVLLDVMYLTYYIPALL